MEGTSDSSDEPDGTGGRLNGISRAHTAGRALGGTSGPGGELHGSSEIAGREMEGTIDLGDEPDGTGGRLIGISRARTAGRALDGTSGLGGELDGTSGKGQPTRPADPLVESDFPISESEIDKTDPAHESWVQDLMQQNLGKFSCLDELKKWRPLPSDPMLHIDLKPGSKPTSRRYPVPVHMYDEFKKFVMDMLEKNFIRPSTSAWSAPVLIVKKPPGKNGEFKGYRFTTDFRGLNACVDPPQYFMPDIQTMYEKLRGAGYISTFDMKNGYWNAGVDEESSDYLAFATPWGTFAYQVVPMGFVSSAAHFQNWVEQKLRKHGILLEWAPLKPAAAAATASAAAAETETAMQPETDADTSAETQIDKESLPTDGDEDTTNECIDSLIDGIPFFAAAASNGLATTAATARDRAFVRNRLWNAGVTTRTRLIAMSMDDIGNILFVNEGCRSRYRDVPSMLTMQALYSKSIGDTARDHQLYDSAGFVATYADDIICVSDTAEEHKAHLQKLFQVLSDELIYLQIPKSHVFCKYVRYLGAIAGNDMLLEDPDKIRAIVNMPMPRNSQTEIRGFLGMTSFWRRWIDSYAQKARPLNDLLKKGVNVKKLWSSAQDDAVNALKRSILKYPILRQYNPLIETRVITDASDYACGAVLAQLHDGHWLPVCFASRTFIAAEKNYSVQEKECLGIVFAVQKFRHYILCSKFKLAIQTDHSSLVFLSKPNNSSGRIARWSMIMSEFDYTVEYIKGSSNVVADQLSRLLEIPDSDWTPLEVDDDTVHPFILLFPALHTVQQMMEFTVGDNDDGWAMEEQRLNTGTDRHHERVLFTRHAIEVDDAVISFSTQHYLGCKDFAVLYGMHLQVKGADSSRRRKLFAAAHDKGGDTTVKGAAPPNDNGQSPVVEPEPTWTVAESKLLSAYRTSYIRDGYLYKVVQNQELLCVPDVQAEGVSTRFDIIALFHDAPWAGHRGVQYTYQTLRRRFHWPRMRQDVETFVGSCSTCSMNKKNRQQPQGEMQPLQIPEQPCVSYHVDFLTDLPPATEAKFDMLMVVVDRHSCRVFAIPTWKRSTGGMVAEQFHDEICARQGRGLPREIISDRDIRFTKGFWPKFMARMGVSCRFTTARTQHANGGAERAIATLSELILCYVNYEQNNWVATLPHLLFAANDSPSDAVGGRSPLFVEMGQHPLRPLDLHTAMPRDEPDPDIATRIARLENLRFDVYEIIAQRRAKSAGYYNEHRRVASELIKPGAKTWLDLSGISLNQFNLRPSAKWNPNYFGPFVVLRQSSPNSFMLELPVDSKIHDVFHVSRLKPWKDPEVCRRKARPLPRELRGDEDYEIERIVDHDFKFGTQWYKVAWKGWSEVYDSTWEPRSDLMKKAAKAVLKYEKENDISKEKPDRRKPKKRR